MASVQVENRKKTAEVTSRSIKVCPASGPAFLVHDLPRVEPRPQSKMDPPAGPERTLNEDVFRVLRWARPLGELGDDVAASTDVFRFAAVVFDVVRKRLPNPAAVFDH